MASDASGDDSFMHRLALDLLRKHEEAVETSTSESSDREAGTADTLTAAAMAARHVLVWHVGAEPSPAQTAAFAREFPDWTLIDDACARGIESGWCEKPDAGHPPSGTDLALVCRRFLDAYAHRHLGEADASVEEPRRAPRARLTSGNKRH